MEIQAFADTAGLLDVVPLPDLVPLRQRFPRPQVGDVEATVAAALNEAEAVRALSPGARVAVAVGSRGIADIAAIVRAVVATLRRQGADPFIVPAMGSHGGATAEGQEAALTSLDISADRVGAPVVSSLEVDLLGRLPNGLPVYMDHAARGADGIVVVNRVKPHTEFGAEIESGLAKMVAIGLGKHAGALALHAWGVEGMARYIPEAARYAVACAPLLCGVANVENAYDEVAEIIAVPPREIGGETERALLRWARFLMARLPWDALDVLVVDTIGKNISGAGMDTNVIGRMRLADAPKPTAAAITNIVALDVTEESHGNALGVGLADFTTVRLIGKLNTQAVYINALTAGVTAMNLCKLPMILATDRAAVAAAIRTCGSPDPTGVRLARVRSTLHLEHILASASSLPHLRQGSDVDIMGEPAPFGVRSDGALEPFPHAHASVT